MESACGGYHQNITDTIMFQKEYDAVIQTLSGRYRGILLCDLRDGSYKIIKAAEDFKDNLTKYTDFREFLRGYSRSCIRPEFRNRIERFAEYEYIQEQFLSGKADRGIVPYPKRKLAAGYGHTVCA